jgi:hypothetical protein
MPQFDPTKITKPSTKFTSLSVSIEPFLCCFRPDESCDLGEFSSIVLFSSSTSSSISLSGSSSSTSIPFVIVSPNETCVASLLSPKEKINHFTTVKLFSKRKNYANIYFHFRDNLSGEVIQIHNFLDARNFHFLSRFAHVKFLFHPIRNVSSRCC